MKKIPLAAKRKCKHSGKYFALVDDELFDELNKYHWSISKNGYAQRRVKIGNRTSIIHMHRQIMGLTFSDKQCVDHINRERLDNRKSNLRLCTRTENNHNMRISKRNKSGAKGVYIQSKKILRVSIMVNGKSIYLGTFPNTPEGFKQAKKAYNDAAKEYYREFVYLNP